jgi:probable HAF family extracellular repeat protein
VLVIGLKCRFVPNRTIVILASSAYHPRPTTGPVLISFLQREHVMNVTVKTVALLAMLLAFPAAGGAQPPAIDLGTLGGVGSVAIAVNDHGQVVGESHVAGDAVSHAFSWTAAGGMVDLGTASDVWSRAVAVNNSGLVVGYIVIGNPKYSGATRAFSWTAARGMVDMGTLRWFCELSG